jgi:hypothetical protein
MDSTAFASALIANRMGQVQLALAAHLARRPDSMDPAAVVKLIAAANHNADALAAAMQPGGGGTIDRSA